MVKASDAIASVRIITCSLLIVAAFMKEKQDIFRNIYSVSAEKCRGYLLWFVKHPNHLNTTCEKASEQIISKSNRASFTDTK